jgi:hypothetical protein
MLSSRRYRTLYWYDPTGYEVEFMTLDGETRAVVSLMPGQIRPTGQ